MKHVKWILILAVLVLFPLCTNAETVIVNQLSFIPAPTWEEAKKLDMEVNETYEEDDATWYWIDYSTDYEQDVSVYYRTSDGRFSWAETSAGHFSTLPDGVWGIIKYASNGKVDNIYFCQEFDSGSSLYSFYDSRMRCIELEYYYAKEGEDDREYWYYNYSNNRWNTSGGATPELPFDGDAVIASVYVPDIRFTVANPSPLVADSLVVTDYETNGSCDHDVWLKLNYSGGMDLVSFHYQIFAKDDEGWHMTWESDSADSEPYFWIGEDGDHYFKAWITDGVSTYELQSDTITFIGNSSASESGSCGDNLTWVYDDGVLSISGVGAMDDYIGEDLPWEALTDSITKVVIGSDVTSIGDEAFKSCTNLSEVTLPEDLTSIGAQAFCFCSALTEVEIPASVTSLGVAAFGATGLTEAVLPDGLEIIEHGLFNGCNNLAGVTIPQSVTSIGGYAFNNCSALISIDIPKNVTSIGANAFAGCTNLESITIPDGVSIIEHNMFTDCISLTSVLLPESVNNVRWEAFKGCSALRDITIPETVTSIGEDAFSGCSSLTSINIPIALEYLDYTPFRGCTGLTDIVISDEHASFGFSGGVFYSKGGDMLFCLEGAASITIPEDVTTLYFARWPDNTNLLSIDVAAGNQLYSSFDGALYNGDGTSLYICPNGKTNISIPEGVTTIGAGAFSRRSRIKQLALPTGVERLNNMAFDGCTALESVFLPESVSQIGNEAFYECAGLTDIWYAGSEEQWNAIDKADTWYSGTPENMIIHFIEDGLLPAPTWSLSPANPTTTDWTNIILDQTYDKVRAYRYKDGESIYGNSATIWSDTNTIGAFQYAPGNYRFVVDCEKNGIWTEEAEIEFIIGDTTEIIGRGSCGDNAAWTLTRGGTLTITGTGAIQGYFISPSGLRSIVRNVSISDGITSIGDGAFTVCKNMESINIPEGVTEIGDSAFYLCEKLKHIDFPSSLKKIGSDAFIFCHELDSIGLPVNVEIITYIRCYEGSLRRITLPSTLESLGHGAFIATKVGEEIKLSPDFNIPEMISTIETGAFEGISASIACVSTNWNRPVQIGNRAFADCKKLKYFIFEGEEPESLEIAGDAFDGCNSDLIFMSGFINTSLNEKVKQYALDHGFQYIEDERFWGNG